jgi:hypothetical protein
MIWQRSEPEPRLSLFPPHQSLIVRFLLSKYGKFLTNGENPMNNNRFSKQNILKGVSVIIGCLLLAVSNLSLIFDVPNFGKLSIVGTLVGIAFFIGGILWHYLDLNHEINTLRSKFPNIVFSEPKHIEITPEQVDLYGEKSLIGSLALHGKIHLFCIDFFNRPVITIGNDAMGAQVTIEFYDKDDDGKASYLGRWIDMPEQSFGIKHERRNISCNNKERRYAWNSRY